MTLEDSSPVYALKYPKVCILYDLRKAIEYTDVNADSILLHPLQNRYWI